MNKDIPNFATWDRNTLDNFAKDAYLQLLRLSEANEQLRQDLKDAMALVRNQYNKDDWK
jgi:hypothetical protein